MSLHSVPNELVTREEMAKRASCSVKTVDRMCAQGMPHVRWGRRLVRFDPDAALSWIWDQRESA